MESEIKKIGQPTAKPLKWQYPKSAPAGLRSHAAKVLAGMMQA